MTESTLPGSVKCNWSLRSRIHKRAEKISEELVVKKILKFGEKDFNLETQEL